MNYDTSDSAITSVVGEMLILVLVIILVSLFATSAFNLLPGDRETATTVSMQSNATHLIFWHKGGDWVDVQDLTITATPKTGGEKLPLALDGVSDYAGNTTAVFDLGGSVVVKTDHLTSGTMYEIRVATLRNVIYAGEYTK
jgi:hypothetical protein